MSDSQLPCAAALKCLEQITESIRSNLKASPVDSSLVYSSIFTLQKQVNLLEPRQRALFKEVLLTVLAGGARQFSYLLPICQAAFSKLIGCEEMEME